MSRRTTDFLTAILARIPFLLVAAQGLAGPLEFRGQEIDRTLTVGYAVQLVDMNDDRQPDIVVVDSDRVIWFENPGWQLHTLIKNQTKRDNVCIAPHDIDGDGKVDFALGADWRPADTTGSGSIQWIGRGATAEDPWKVYPIGTEPTVHRLRWIDLENDAEPELVVVPLFGRGTKGPHFAAAAVRILAYKIPEDPVNGVWKPEVLNESLHVSHNFWPGRLSDSNSIEVLVASFEGVSLLAPPAPSSGTRLSGWTARLIGSGNQETSPNRGSSEVKPGRVSATAPYVATIEPWHGFQVVVYTPPQTGKPSESLWERQVLDDELAWGHAVWCANLDDDPAEELIVGVRDNKSDTARSGIRVYDPQDAAGRQWKRTVIDPGGVAVEDAMVGDLNDDGRADIIAVGRATHNVRIYWNEAP